MNILDLRENRIKYIEKELRLTTGALISIKANYPGKDKKNIYTSYTVLKVLIELKTLFDFKIIKTEFDNEGLIFILKASKDPLDIKELALNLEEGTKLGRLVDIDVFMNKGQVSRESFDRPLRKCFICDKPAVLCSRAQNHSPDEIEEYFVRTVEEYVTDKAGRLLEFALFTELARKVSLGTVTVMTNGNHQDMDFMTFLKSAQALSDFYEKKPQGYNFDDLRLYGLEAEKIMLKATKGVNTHKGAIFASLLVLASVKESASFDRLQRAIKDLGQESLKDFNEVIKPESNGESLYSKFGIRGARGSAAAGYKNIFDKYLKSFEEDLDLDRLFLDIANDLEDTNAIKRLGIKKYQDFKKLMKSQKLPQLEKYARENRLSLGGTCDILSMTVMIYIIKKHFEKTKERIWK